MVAKLKGYMEAAYEEPRSQQHDGKYTGKPPTEKELKKKEKKKAA